jgi:hypothetical protein
MSIEAQAFLQAHGVEAEPHELNRALVEAVAQRRAMLRGPSTHELTTGELGILRDGGLDPEPRDGDDPLNRTLVDQAALIRTSLSVSEMARRLGVDPSRIRQRLGARSLFGVRTAEGWVLPPFQLDGDQTLPGLVEVLQALDPNLHLLEVEMFFMTPDEALISTRIGQALSPRDWLRAGFSPDAVAELAAEL